MIQRWQYCTDIHGNQLDEKVCEAALRFRDKFKPAVRIIGGDLFDLGALRNGASDEDKYEGIQADVAAGMKFFRDFQPTHMLMGNHDYRAVEKAQKKQKNGLMREACLNLIASLEEECAKIGCKLFPYDVKKGIFRYGGYNVMHGYMHNMHSANAMAAAYGNSIMGHVHTFSMSTFANVDCPMGYTCGMMADPEKMTYARRHRNFLRWQQGWMYGWRPEPEQLVVNLVKAAKDYIFYPTEFSQ